MTDWSEWETIHHQVALGGRVADEADAPVAGAQVTATTLPPEGGKRGRGGQGAGAAEGDTQTRVYTTIARPNGLYFFLDLPDGRYAMRAVDPRTGRHGERTVELARARSQPLNERWVDFMLTGGK